MVHGDGVSGPFCKWTPGTGLVVHFEWTLRMDPVPGDIPEGIFFVVVCQGVFVPLLIRSAPETNTIPRPRF